VACRIAEVSRSCYTELKYHVPSNREIRRLLVSALVADVARELGVVEQTLGNWVRQERIDRGEREGTSTEMREENARFRREVKRLSDTGSRSLRAIAFEGRRRRGCPS
jgi:transposase-like protein